MATRAQTFVPQRAPGALWPRGTQRPLRPVGCMRGLGGAGRALFRRNHLNLEIHRIQNSSIDRTEPPDDPYARGARLPEAQGIRMGEGRFVPEAGAAIAWHLIVRDESSEASRHGQVIPVSTGAVATPNC